MNGREYKLLYMDTNVLNAFAKNTNFFSKNFMESYAMGGYMFVTSVFNLYEVYQTQGESRANLLKIFDMFPIGIVIYVQQIIEYERMNIPINKNILMFAIGNNELFNLNMSKVFDMFEEDETKKAIEKMHKNFNKEMKSWNAKKEKIKWMENFDLNMIDSMNDSFSIYDSYFKITELGKHKSLETLAYIKNKYIYDKDEEIKINSVIDAYNASIFPYIDVYVTERTVGAWLKEAKRKLTYLEGHDIKTISEIWNKV